MTEPKDFSQKGDLIESQKQEISSFIDEHMQRNDFVMYMNYCVKKWKRLEIDLQIIDSIMSSVCKHWDISKDKLMEDKKLYEPRAMMYYIIKKQINLSYGEMGELFCKQKSYIHKAIDDMTFLVEQRGKKDVVVSLQSIKNDLTLKNPNVFFEDGIKS